MNGINDLKASNTKKYSTNKLKKESILIKQCLSDNEDSQAKFSEYFNAIDSYQSDKNVGFDLIQRSDSLSSSNSIFKVLEEINLVKGEVKQLSQEVDILSKS